MSDVIRKADFVSNLFTFLVETFESPPKPSSAYLDRKAGFFDTLETISAEQASRPITKGATSIAAQVEHTRFYLAVIAQFMDGRTEKVDWQESWRVTEVTPEDWTNLKQALKTTYNSLSQRLRSIEVWGDDEVGDSMAIVIHTAYHLGAVRQMVNIISETPA